MIITNEIALQLGLTPTQVLELNKFLAFINVKSVSELLTVMNPVSGNIVFEDGDGKLKKIPINVFYQLIGGLAKPISPGDAAPVVTGWYKPRVYSADPGTNYPNLQNVKAVKGFDTLFYFDGTNWVDIKNEMPQADFDEAKFNEEAETYKTYSLLSRNLAAVSMPLNINPGDGTSIFTSIIDANVKISKLRVKVVANGIGNFSVRRGGVISSIVSNIPLVAGWNDVLVNFDALAGDYIGYNTQTSTSSLYFGNGTGGNYYLSNGVAFDGNIALEVYKATGVINTFENLVKADLNGNKLIQLAGTGLASINLFNINDSTILPGSAINGSYNIITISDFSLSHWIPLEPSTEYTWLKYGLGSKHMQFTDASKVKVTGSPGGVTVGAGGTSNVRFSFTTPANCFGGYYTCKSSAESSIPAQMMLVKGTGLKADGVTELDFAPFAPPIYTGNEIIADTGKIILADQLKAGAKMDGKNVATVNDITGFLPAIPSGFVTVVASGTSITNGIGSDGGAGIDASKAWRSILQTTLTNVLGRTITVVNGGINGQNTTGMRTNLSALLSGVTGQVVIIEGAINDAQTAGSGLPITTTISNLNSMIDAVVASGNIPILTTPMPLDLSISALAAAYTNQKRCDLAYAVRRVAKIKNVRLVDFDKLTNNDYSLMVDGLHPNPKGYLFMANAMSSEFV